VSVGAGSPRTVGAPVYPPTGLETCVCAAQIDGGVIVHSVPFRGSRPRGIAAPAGVGESLTQSLRECRARGAIAWRARALSRLARDHVTIPGQRKRMSGAAEAPLTQTGVQGPWAYGTLPEASLTHRLAAHLVTRADGARDRTE
jgi:hypothetical protein